MVRMLEMLITSLLMMFVINLGGLKNTCNNGRNEEVDGGSPVNYSLVYIWIAPGRSLAVSRFPFLFSVHISRVLV